MSKSHKIHSKGSSGHGKRGSDDNQGPPLSFLFMANRLDIASPDRDIYYHHLPPSSPRGYHGEVASKVMRYSNGQVTEAAGYQWIRNTDDPNLPNNYGRLCRFDAAQGVWYMMDTGDYWHAEVYKTFAVAACNPLLPIMVVDQDPLVNETGPWHLLQIFHPRGRLEGVSQVVTPFSEMSGGGGPVRYVAGKSPSWIPGLLPKTYRSPRANPPPSTGLGGELPIILGLMALSASSSRTNEVFLGRNARWQRGAWSFRDQPASYPATAQDDPKAFLVNVFLDPDNGYGSTPETLYNFEWKCAVVHG
ncbi:hypothetical protein ACJ41O_010607 [Fusarium nematophilum]